MTDTVLLRRDGGLSWRVIMPDGAVPEDDINFGRLFALGDVLALGVPAPVHRLLRYLLVKCVQAVIPTLRPDCTRVCLDEGTPVRRLKLQHESLQREGVEVALTIARVDQGPTGSPNFDLMDAEDSGIAQLYSVVSANHEERLRAIESRIEDTIRRVLEELRFDDYCDTVKVTNKKKLSEILQTELLLATKPEDESALQWLVNDGHFTRDLMPHLKLCLGNSDILRNIFDGESTSNIVPEFCRTLGRQESQLEKLIDPPKKPILLNFASGWIPVDDTSMMSSTSIYSLRNGARTGLEFTFMKQLVHKNSYTSTHGQQLGFFYRTAWPDVLQTRSFPCHLLRGA